LVLSDGDVNGVSDAHGIDLDRVLVLALGDWYVRCSIKTKQQAADCDAMQCVDS